MGFASNRGRVKANIGASDNQYLLSGALNRVGYFGDFASSLFSAWLYMIVSLERSFCGFGLISWDADSNPRYL